MDLFPHLLYTVKPTRSLIFLTSQSHNQHGGHSSPNTHLVSPEFTATGNDVEPRTRGAEGVAPSVSVKNPVFLSETGSAVVMMQSQDGGAEGMEPTSVSAQQAAQFWGKGPVELDLLGNGHCACQVSLLPLWHWGNSYTYAHMQNQGCQGRVCVHARMLVCVYKCVWYSGLDYTLMHDANQQGSLNICLNITLWNSRFSPPCSVIKELCLVLPSSSQIFQAHFSSLVCPSDRHSSLLYVFEAPFHKTLMLWLFYRKPSHEVFAHVCECVSVCMVHVADSAWSPVMYWDPSRPEQTSSGMLTCFFFLSCVLVLCECCNAAHKKKAHK